MSEFESEIKIECPWLEGEKEFSPITDEEFEIIKANMIPGIYEEAEGLRFSTLRQYLESPWYYDNNQIEHVDTKATYSGTAFHCFLLEPEKFEKTFKVFQAPINKTTGKPFLSGKAYETALDEFKQSGFMPLNEGEREDFNVMMSSALVSGHLDYFTDGMAEVPLSTNRNGHIEKCKIDFISRKYGIVDVKTTSKSLSNAVQSDSFRWEIRDRCYCEQLVYYKQILEDIIGREVPCHLVVFENSKPFRVSHYVLTALTKERVKNTLEDWREMYYSEEKDYPKLNWEL